MHDFRHMPTSMHMAAHLHQHAYGRPAEVFNDHKPIQAILQKSFCQAQNRVQALLMRLNY